MNAARIRLMIFLVLFLGWLGWLASAVTQKGKTVLVSRGQLTAATHIVVAEVAVGEDGLPSTTAKVTELLRGTEIPLGMIEVINLTSACPPGTGGFPGPGLYLLPVVGDGRTFRVAGLPRSPGYEASTLSRPSIYPWNEGTQAQMKALGIIK